MARDKSLEALLSDDLANLSGLSQKAIFGGLTWLLDGKLLCGARTARILIRLGKGNDAWALRKPAITTAAMGSRPMLGWISVAPEPTLTTPYASNSFRKQ